MKFRYGELCGSLVCSEEVPGVTEVLEPHQAEFYQGTHFVAESMSRPCAEKLATLLGGELE